MRRLFASLVGTLSVSAALFVGNVVHAPAADAATGCSSGYVCFYKNGSLVSRYFNYGTYNLSGYYGVYHVANCQNDWATLNLWRGYNGTDHIYSSAVPNNVGCHEFDYDMTPINSISLNRTR